MASDRFTQGYNGGFKNEPPAFEDDVIYMLGYLAGQDDREQIKEQM